MDSVHGNGEKFIECHSGENLENMQHEIQNKEVKLGRTFNIK